MYLKSSRLSTSEQECHLPRDLQFLWQVDEAFRAVDSIRWPLRKYCPRCNSLFTKSVNTAIFRELYRCVDCGYMFNTFSGTIFQGAKIPVVKFFQLFVLYDAIGKDISPRDVSYAIDVSHKTSVALIGRLGGLDKSEKFASMDREKAELLRTRSKNLGFDQKFESFFLYCDMKNIVVDVDLFKRYLAVVLAPKNTTEAALPPK